MKGAVPNQPSPDPATCPKCGRAMPRGGGVALCPVCLMKQGMAEDTDLGDPEGPAGRAGRHLPDQEEVAGLFPQFEILECLGRGGMGVVYRARQKSLDRLVALKILAPERENDPDFADRFAREAKTLAQLNHPNIVTVYEFGESRGVVYFVMELVDGVTLRNLIADRLLSPEEAIAIVPAICDALQYAHDNGVVHRDIKPENLLLDKHGRVKVADFGIAKIMETAAGQTGAPVSKAEGKEAARTGTGRVAGTPKYMAPEQKAGATVVDHRTDIYSLGLVFYEMLTGELPQDDIRPPSSHPGISIDVRLDAVVLRALEKTPARRYQQVSEIQTDVRTFALPPPAVPRNPGSSGRQRDKSNSARRNTVMWYYIENGENKGPVEARVLGDLRERQALPPDTPVWREGMDEWVPLHAANLGGEEPDVPGDPLKSEATSDGGDVPVAAHAAGKERSRSRKIGGVFLLLLAVLGLATYFLYPFLPHEYLYDRSTAGVHSRYPLPGEDYDLLTKRFTGSIVRDGEIREGRAIRIEKGDCEHLVWVQDGRVEAILIRTAVGTIDAPTVATDFLNHSSRAGTFELRGEGLWWNPRHEAAMAIKGEEAILIATERGLALLEER